MIARTKGVGILLMHQNLKTIQSYGDTGAQLLSGLQLKFIHRTDAANADIALELIKGYTALHPRSEISAWSSKNLQSLPPGRCVSLLNNSAKELLMPVVMQI